MYTTAKQNDYIKLTYMNARWYDSSIGRFISADTIVPDPTNPQSFNRYAYVRNNPINFTDPTGHCREGYMGDDYDDAGCLEIAQDLSHQTGISMDLLALYDWGIRNPSSGPIGRSSLDAGVKYQQLRNRNGSIITHEGYDVYLIGTAQARPINVQTDTIFPVEIEMNIALVTDRPDVSYLGSFTDAADDYADSLENDFILNRDKNHSGWSIVSDVVDVAFNFVDILAVDVDPGDWVSAAAEGGLDIYAREITKTELFLNGDNLTND